MNGYISDVCNGVCDKARDNVTPSIGKFLGERPWLSVNIATETIEHVTDVFDGVA